MIGRVSLIESMARAESAEERLGRAVHEHSRLVFAVTYAVLRNRADAEDAVQETFLRAMRHPGEFARVEDQRAWLAKAGWRIAVDQARKRKNASLSDEGDEGLLGKLREAELAEAARGEASGGAEALAIGGQMQGLLERLIGGLKPELREVLVLSTVEEMNSREIGGVLGIPEGTVRTRLQRARTQLEEKLAALLQRREGSGEGSGRR